MAKRGPKPKPDDHPDRFTDRVRGMRRRFKTELHRTLLTFCHMQERSYLDAAAKMAGKTPGVNAAVAAGMAESFRALARAYGVIASDLMTPWSEYKWREADGVVMYRPDGSAPPEGE